VSVFITGGAGGLGIELGRAFLARGHAVALIDVAEGVVSVAQELSIDEPGRVIGLTVDTTRPQAVDDAWTAAEEALGPIESVVNAAGIVVRGGITEIAEADWARCLDVNLTGPFHVCRRAAQAWVPAGRTGAIVNIASVAAMKAAAPPIGSVGYGASKAGLVGLTIHLAVELGPHGIRSNAVAPGSFASPMNRERLADPEVAQATADAVPLKRIGAASEVAGLTVYLALDAAYVNGAVIACDGGTVVQL
jgi:NAD(P)-dependent dehydrogenase (short-subunit alcohol dehydrogenase family)